MKKTAILLLLIISSFAAKGQDSVIYTYEVYNPCTNTVQLPEKKLDIILWNQKGAWFKERVLCDSASASLHQIGGYHFKFMDSIILPDTGLYYIGYRRHGNNALDERYIQKVIYINSFGVFKDTLTKRTIEYDIVDYDKLLGYKYCGAQANGYCIDYHLNDTIKMKGNFINGWPIDTMYTYNHKGICLEKYLRYDNVSYYSEVYYPDGKLKRKTIPIKVDGSFSYKYPYVPDSIVDYSNRQHAHFRANHEFYKYDTTGNVVHYYYRDSLKSISTFYKYENNKLIHKSTYNHITYQSKTYHLINGEWVEQKEEE